MKYHKLVIMAILTIFIAVLALCFAHTAMMMAPVTASGCFLSTSQSMCPLQQIMSSWQNLFIALPQINLTAVFLLLASIIFFIFIRSKKISYDSVRNFIVIYSKTYPNFSSLNFLSYAFSRGILHPKIF